MSLVSYLNEQKELISPGISACIGCNVELTLRTVLRVLGEKTVLAIPPGCMGGVGVVGWNKKSGARVPVFFSLLDNTASMLAGIKAHFQRKGEDVNVVAFAGDGATVDAGFQCLSGAAERGDNIIYICYDNEGYMNTGYQRSGSTSKGAWTSTTPVNREGEGGKLQHKKDIALIMAMHGVPYVATATPAYMADLVRKIQKAKTVKDGMAFIHVYNPCVTGWGISPEKSIEVSRLAVQTCFFPLYEVEYGKFTLSQTVKNPKPVAEFVKLSKKFSHLTGEEIQGLQGWVKDRWIYLQGLAKAQALEKGC